MSVVIIGAGGHAKVVADILLQCDFGLLGYVDDAPETWGSIRLEIPVLGPIEQLKNLQFDGVICAIGANHVRQVVVEQYRDVVAGRWISAVHPRATIGRGVTIGEGTAVAAGAIINADTSIGRHTIINTSASVDHDCHISEFVHIAPGAHLAGGVTIGTGSLIGVGVAAIPNVTVGEWSVVGAGATVINIVPDRVVAKGTPAIWDTRC